MKSFRSAVPLSLAATLVACAHNPFGGDRAASSAPLDVSTLGAPPEGCIPQPAVKSVPRLRLPRTEAPRAESKGKSLEFAQVHTVNRPLEDAGTWTDFDDGWSLLSLTLGSEGAQSLAVRLRDATLPERGEVWLCSADRRVRQGPYREVTGGDLWTPVVPGSEALLQIWVPTVRRTSFRALLADAYGGYR